MGSLNIAAAYRSTEPLRSTSILNVLTLLYTCLNLDEDAKLIPINTPWLLQTSLFVEISQYRLPD